MNNGLSFISSSVTITAVACVSRRITGLIFLNIFQREQPGLAPPIWKCLILSKAANRGRIQLSEISPCEVLNPRYEIKLVKWTNGVHQFVSLLVQRDLRSRGPAHPAAALHRCPPVVVLASLLHRGMVAEFGPSARELHSPGKCAKVSTMQPLTHACCSAAGYSRAAACSGGRLLRWRRRLSQEEVAYSGRILLWGAGRRRDQEDGGEQVKWQWKTDCHWLCSDSNMAAHLFKWSCFPSTQARTSHIPL